MQSDKRSDDALQNSAVYWSRATGTVQATPKKKTQQKSKHVEIFQVNEDLSSPSQHVHIYNALYGASRSH